MQIARRLLLLAIFAGLLVGGWRFAASNSTPVEVDYLVGTSSDAALWAVLAVTFAIGAAAAGVVAGYALARGHLLARRYRKRLAGLEAEVHQLRNLPLVSDGTARGEDALDASG
jgi:uncharacterized membrane protein YciS (DUF1049 family)